MAEDSTMDVTIKSPIDSRILECPICLELFRTPKLLPCSHSFCQECLGSYIVKEVHGQKDPKLSFSCPVCQKTTHPVNSEEDKSLWSKQFPTNTLALDMLQFMDKEREPYFCSACVKKGNTKTTAIFWCKTNRSLFCEACKVNYHDIVHDDCELLDITLKPEPISELTQDSSVTRCLKHREKMEYFCEDHQVIGCNKCIILNHRRCEVVTTTDEYVENLTNSSQITEKMELLEKSKDSLEMVLKNVDEESEAVVLDEDTAFKSISHLREQINNYLDRKQQIITDELSTSMKGVKENLQLTKQKCERLKTAIVKTLESFKMATRTKICKETILLFQRGKAEIENSNELVTDIRKSFTSVRIKHKSDLDFSSTKHDTALNLGKLDIERKRKNIEVGGNVNYPPLAEREAKEIATINIKGSLDRFDCSPRGVVYLPTGQIVLGDYRNEKLKLFAENGQFLYEMEVTGNPMDMCVVDSNTVAAAITNPGVVKVVNVQSSILSLLYEVKVPISSCGGIVHRPDEFIVMGDRAIYSLMRDGRNDLLRCTKSDGWHLGCDARTGDVLVSYGSDAEGQVVVSRVTHNVEINVLKVGLVKGGRGIDVDSEGNVYVCGNTTNNVIQMSGDGTNVRELLKSSDILPCPRALSVCGDKLVLTNQSTEKRNYIQIFQLA